MTDNTIALITIIAGIIGPGTGIGALIFMIVFVRQERRKRNAEGAILEADAKTKEASAGSQEADTAVKVKAMAMEMAQEYKKSYDIIIVENKNIRTEFETLRVMYYKMNGKVNRIVQLVKQNSEYRKKVAEQTECLCSAQCIGNDDEMMKQINLIMLENGETK
jgi:hypothetical protein